MTTKEKIKWIIDNRSKLQTLYGLSVIDDIDKVDGFGHKRNYLLISTDNSRSEKIKRLHFSREVTVIFIEGGVWQYRYINVQPSKREYYPLEKFLDAVIWRMKRGT